MRKCWLPAFSSFSAMFFITAFFEVIKTQDHVEKFNVFNIRNSKTLHSGKSMIFAVWG